MIVSTDDDSSLAATIRRTVKRTKRLLSYAGSHSTDDLVGGLIAKWIESGEYNRLKALGASRPSIYQSVRQFIVDRIRATSTKKREGTRVSYSDDLSLPDGSSLEATIADCEARMVIRDEVARLLIGEVSSCAIELPKNPVALGEVLRGVLEGKTQRMIANDMKVSLGAVNALYQVGLVYLSGIILADRIR